MLHKLYLNCCLLSLLLFIAVLHRAPDGDLNGRQCEQEIAEGDKTFSLVATLRLA